MEIEIIKTNEIQSTVTNSLDSVRVFGLFLLKVQASIHMVHWFTLNYNAHKILGKLYEDLDGLFDSLEEEIIGTSRSTTVIFPLINPNICDLDNISKYNDMEAPILDTYYSVASLLVETLSSLEFKNYLQSVKSGINNTVEDIISRVNKANYLLGLIGQ